MTDEDESLAAFAAEPMEYFSHDADAAQDIKCRKLIRRQDMAGYGRWWVLCELLAGIKGHIFCIRTEEELDLLAESLYFDEVEDCKAFLDDLAEIGLINADAYQDGIIGSERMGRNSLFLAKKRAASKKANEARWGNNRNAKQAGKKGTKSGRNPNGVRTESERNTDAYTVGVPIKVKEK